MFQNESKVVVATAFGRRVATITKTKLREQRPREDAAATAAATEFCKSTVATTEIKPQLIQQRVRERKQQLTSANQQLHH